MNGIKSELLEELSGVKYYISQKNLQEPFVFSQALHTGQDSKLIWQNRQKIASFFPSKAHFISVMQIHSDYIYKVEKPLSRGWYNLDKRLRADALITDIPNIVLTILTADCVPILLFDPTKRVIGAIHAGWRGSKLDITKKTVQELKKSYGVTPSNLYAFIAPSIRSCCYEVSDEIASYFADIKGAVIYDNNIAPKLDLARVNQYQLIDMGVVESKIEISEMCTSCESNTLFSYRKEEGCLGRFMSSIMIE